MIKRMLGLDKIERRINGFTDSVVRSWEWIKHLNNVNEQYDERLKRLEQSNIKLIDLTNQLLKRIEDGIYEYEEEAVKEVEAPRAVLPERIASSPANVNLPNKDMFIMQIMYQYAAFDKQNPISTQEIYNNLTYKITDRGLRKKLESLNKAGLLAGYKKGNTRYWHLNPGMISKIKQAIKEES